MLPNGWKKVKLGEICDKIGSGSTPKGGREVYLNAGIPIIRSQNVLNGFLDLNDVAFISDEQHSKMKGTWVHPNDILLNITGASIGRSCVVPATVKTANVNQHVCIIRLKECADACYVCNLILSKDVQKQIELLSVGGGRQGLNFQQIASFSFLLPPIEEQKKIAATLSVWDSAIEKMEKLIEAKENAKQFFFYKLVTENSCLWEIKKLSDFLTPGNKTPVLNTSLYRKMIVKLHKKGLEFNTQTREMADTRPFYIRNEGELIIGKQNYFNGSIAMVDKEHDQCICSNAIMSFSIKDIHPLYLYEYISDEEYLKKHSMLANGTGQKELSEKDFLNFEIRVPKRKQQDEIVCVLNNCSLEIFLLHAQLENYKKQKQGLMQKLLTGEWRVK